MFAVVVFKSAGLLKRYSLYKNPVIKIQNVKGAFPFYIIETAKIRNTVNTKRILSIAEEKSLKLIFPKGFECENKNLLIDESQYKKLLLFNTALDILKRNIKEGQRLTLCIEDDRGIFSDRVSLFLPFISLIYIKTDNPQRYRAAIKNAMEEFGAGIRICEKINADIVLNLDSDEKGKKLSFNFYGGICGENISLPPCIFNLCPKGTDEIKFSCALYSHSHLSALSCLKFKNVTVNGKFADKCSVDSFVKGAIVGSAIDNQRLK